MPGTGRRERAPSDAQVGSGNDVDRNERQPAPGSGRPDDQHGAARPGQWPSPPSGPVPPIPTAPVGVAGPPHQGQPGGSYPPEHRAWTRPPSGQPDAGHGGQPGSPAAPDGHPPHLEPDGQYAPGQPPYSAQAHHQSTSARPPYAPPYERIGQPPIGQAPVRRGFSAGPPVAPTIGRRKGSILPALFFGGLAVILGVLAVYLYFQERGTDGPVAPTALPARNQYANVSDALQATGLKVVEATRTDPGATSPSSFPSDAPSGTVGQYISIDGRPAWIYLFPDAKGQAAAADAFAAAPEPLTTASRKPLTTAPPALFHASNVVVLLSVDDDPGQDVRDRIQRAVESLP